MHLQIVEADGLLTRRYVPSVPHCWAMWIGLIENYMFVVGAAVPTVAWGIAALEFDRNHTTKRSLASAAMYALLVVSLILFCVAGWRLPRAFLDSLQITVEFSDAL